MVILNFISNKGFLFFVRALVIVAHSQRLKGGGGLRTSQGIRGARIMPRDASHSDRRCELLLKQFLSLTGPALKFFLSQGQRERGGGLLRVQAADVARGEGLRGAQGLGRPHADAHQGGGGLIIDIHIVWIIRIWI